MTIRCVQINRANSNSLACVSLVPHRSNRQGSVLTLMAMVLPVVAIFSAFCINAAYVQLTRTELSIATDAAARAGGRAFSELQSVELAKNAAIATAALNLVNGSPLQLQAGNGANEIEFGITTQSGGTGSRYEFQKIPTDRVSGNTMMASAVRVNGMRTPDSLSGSVKFLIPGMFNFSHFSPTQQAVAMQVDRDISLVVDRSGSMDWIEDRFPPGKSAYSSRATKAAVAAGQAYIWRGNLYPTTTWSAYEKWVWQNFYDLGNPPNTPWEDLVLAVDAFLNVLDETPQSEQVSLSSYESTASFDIGLTKNFDSVRAEIATLGPLGGTAIGSGMETGIQAHVSDVARPFATKTMVVMTDGINNAGSNPITVANYFAANYNVTIHTITFGPGANQSYMQTIADIGGGNHYHAENGEQLIAVFEEIANNLPTILTQ